MSDFKEIQSSGIPKEYRDNAKICFMCSEPANNGGTFVGNNEEHLITVCSKPSCKRDIINWAIDVYVSDKESSLSDIKEEFLDFIERTYDEKTEMRPKFR